MNRAFVIGVGLVLVVLLLLFSATYTVRFNQVAIKSTFGQADEEDVIREPGLKFKMPIFANRVQSFDTRLQYLQSPDEEIPTADQQSVVVRSFLIWRVDRDNVSSFARSHDSLSAAGGYLRPRFRDALSAVSAYEFNDLLGPDHRLDEVEDAVLAQLAGLREVGIEPVAVGISQLQLPPKATQAVLKRMDETRTALADAERSKGLSEAERIESNAKTLAEAITSFAAARAEDIRAESGRQAAEYLARMSEDPELAKFLVWRDALAASLRNNTTFVIELTKAPFHLLNLRAETDGQGIPQPEEGSEIEMARRRGED